MVCGMQSGSAGGGGTEPDSFMEVWARNVDHSFTKIRYIVQEYPYVAMVRGLLYIYPCD